MAPENDGKRRPKSFEALTPELSEWILDFTRSMGFSRTTPVQAMAIPLLLGNKDLVVEAVTGSGKTLCFLIPLVERILKAEEPNRSGHVRSIVVAPTQELASQIFDVLRGLLEFHPPSAALRHRADSTHEDDESPDNDEGPDLLPGPYVIPQLLIGGRTTLSADLASFSRTNPNVLVGTPKRLVEVLQSARVQVKRPWFDLLVLDEADRLLDPNFQPDLQKILSAVPKERRTGLFSASVSEAVNELVRVGMRYPFKISAKVRSANGALDKRTPESLRLYHVVTKPTTKLPRLRSVLRETQASKSIVYVSTRAGVDYWSPVLRDYLGYYVFPLHGDHKSVIRAKNLQRFRDAAEPAVLLTTDVLARGIDIPDIDLVVQMDPPTQPKDFLHRCGRSGRAGKRGTAVTFLHEGSEEDYVRYLGLQGIALEQYPATHPPPTDEDAGEATRAIRASLLKKRELHDRSQRAFVSWVQAYSKTLPADIFSVRKLDWLAAGKAWGLLRWPKMPELRRFLPEASADRSFGLDLPLDFDLDSVAYRDSVRESRRLAAPTAAEQGAAKRDQRRRTERAWSGKKEARTLREERRGKKERRRKAEQKAGMSEKERERGEEVERLIAQVRAQHGDAEEFAGFED